MAIHLQHAVLSKGVCGVQIQTVWIQKAADEHTADDEYHLTMAMEAQVVMFSCLRSAFNTEFKTVLDVSLLLISFHPCLQSMPTCYPCPT